MKLSLLIAVLFCSFQVFAQEESQSIDAEKESRAYHKFRMYSTTPTHQLAKVRDLMKKMESEHVYGMKLPNEVFNSLTFSEKFTYAMIHGESYSQNCNGIPIYENEHQKIFGYLQDPFGQYSWSERQYQILQSHRDSVMILIEEYVSPTNRIGLNYKQAVVHINGWEMIPFLITTYQTDRRDRDILTVLLQLMKKNEYKPFMASTPYNMLYGKNENFRASLELTTANEALIIEHAGNFYKSKR